MKIVNVIACKDCPYLRRPWNCLYCNDYACGNSFGGATRSIKEEDWLGGNALPGDRIIKNINIIQSWCKLNSIEK